MIFHCHFIGNSLLTIHITNTTSVIIAPALLDSNITRLASTSHLAALGSAGVPLSQCPGSSRGNEAHDSFGEGSESCYLDCHNEEWLPGEKDLRPEAAKNAKDLPSTVKPLLA